MDMNDRHGLTRRELLSCAGIAAAAAVAGVSATAAMASERPKIGRDGTVTVPAQPNAIGGSVRASEVACCPRCGHRLLNTRRVNASYVMGTCPSCSFYGMVRSVGGADVARVRV